MRGGRPSPSCRPQLRDELALSHVKPRVRSAAVKRRSAVPSVSRRLGRSDDADASADHAARGHASHRGRPGSRPLPAVRRAPRPLARVRNALRQPGRWVIALDNDGSCLVDGVRGGDGRPDDAANDAAKNTAEDCVAIVAPVGEGVEG